MPFSRQTPWVILGCGYTGQRLAVRLLSEGHAVVATRRTASGVAELESMFGRRLDARVVDLDRPDAVDGLIPARSVIAHCAPPGDDDTAELRLVRAARAAGARRLVYVSSTGVYPPAEGGWIDEDTPASPASARGQARFRAEQALLTHARDHGLDVAVLRSSGIYGPGRGVHARLRAGTFRVIGDGDTYVNRIHVDDLVQAVIAAGTIPVLSRRVYLVADDAPCGSREIADAVASMLGIAPPPSVPIDQVSPDVASMLTSNRRVRNSRVKGELGVRWRYPSWHAGVAQSIAEDDGVELTGK